MGFDEWERWVCRKQRKVSDGTSGEFMSKEKHGLVISDADIERRIYFVRGLKVMLSGDLANLYAVPHKVMMQSVKRNIERFPDDFMFQLTRVELANLKSQFVTSSWGGLRKRPFAFTEQGVAMLSGVLRSKRAIQVNVAIMRTFVKLRELLSDHKELAEQFSLLERKVEKHDHEIHAIFEAIRRLMDPPSRPKRTIGFKIREPKAGYHIGRKKS